MSVPKEFEEMEELNFENPPYEITEENELKNVLLQLETSSNENEQKQLIKEIVEICKSRIDEIMDMEAMKCVLNIFMKYTSKKALRKDFHDNIINVGMTDILIRSTTKEILDTIKYTKKCNLRLCTELFNFISYIQMSPTFHHEGLVEQLFPLYFLIYRAFVHQSKSNFINILNLMEDLLGIVNVVLKQMLLAFVKDVPYSKILSEEYSMTLILLSYDVIKHEKIGFDIKTKAGLILTHSFQIIPEKFLGNIKYRDCVPLELLEEYNEDNKLILLNHELGVFSECEQLVIIYGSILNVLPKEKLCQVEINDKILICLLYDGLMQHAKRSTNIPHLIVEISRTLSIISKHMKGISLTIMEPLFLQGLSFVWSHIQHFVDTVRNYVRSFFTELVIIAAEHRNKGCDRLCEILIENIKMTGKTETIKFIALENVVANISCSYLLTQFDNIGEDVLKALSHGSISEEVCKTYTLMMENHFKEVNVETWINIWVKPPISLLNACPHCRPACQKIIIRAFQLHPPILHIIFPNDYIGSYPECEILLKCLHYARQNGMELLVKNKNNVNLYWRGLIDKEKLENFMIHQNDEIRLSVLSVIVVSQKTTEIFLNWELNFLSNFIRYNIVSQIPHIRNQITSLYRKGLARFNAGFYVIKRNMGLLEKRVKLPDVTMDIRNTLTIYRELDLSYRQFLQHFSQYLISNLTFDSNFPRRSISLELLLSIQSFVPRQQWERLWSDDDIKNCHSVLFDSYESNKKIADALLKNLPTSSIGFSNADFTFKYLQRCFNLAVEIRPSKSLSAAYLLQVCARSPYFKDIINNSSENANPSLDMVVILIGKLVAQTKLEIDLVNSKVSNYGLILCIRHIIQTRDITKNNHEYSELFERLTSICLNLTVHLMPIVCNPSPEGYLPDGEILNDTDETAKAQMILVYAWRTVKEMSFLFGEMIRQTVKTEKELQMLSLGTILKIGEFFLKLFVSSKHKGVFEQSYIPFCVICDSFWTSSDANLKQLPELWLQDSLMLCTGETQSNTLCCTRRSAGLPFLILAIIGSEPVFNKLRFDKSITVLLEAVQNEEASYMEYRMHCLNVLRAMFRHSRIGELVAPYVAKGVIIAINGFKSDIWGIRNSATLLYACLIIRMFGVQRTQDSENLSSKNRLTVKVFFLRYPELFQFLLDTLIEECKKHDSLLLHPVLMILSRLDLSHSDENDPQMEKYIPHLTTCLSNSVYRTRELAALACINFIGIDKISSHFHKIFSRLNESKINDNEAHGYLLQVFHLIKVNSCLSDFPISDYLYKTIKILKFVGQKFSHLTASLYLKVVLLLLLKYPNYEDLGILKKIVRILSRQITTNLIPTTGMSNYFQLRMSLLLYITVNKFEENELTFTTVTNQLMCQLYGQNLEMKKFCLYLLIYLNQLQTGYKHSLFQTEELQIPTEITTLGDSFDRKSISKILTTAHQYLKCFLTEEVKHEHYIRNEDRVLLFLLLNYYPCAIKHLNLNKQETLNMFIKLCNCDNSEELISAVVSCMSTFLQQLDYSVLNYDELLKVLVESASPAASDFRRLAVCDFLCKNYILYCNEDSILTGDDLQMVLSMVMVLLEDDDVDIRNAMSEFATILKVKITLSSNTGKPQSITTQKWGVIPDKARNDLLKLSSIILPKQRAICFLFSWTCRHFPDTTTCIEGSEVFDKGELNTYSENVSFSDLCGELIYDKLWVLEDGLSYEDYSILIEEHVLLVTTVLLDSIVKYPSPMMLYKTKVSVICALKMIIKFLERVEISKNFLEIFKNHINETILKYLTKNIDQSDLFSVKWIIRNIYSPILKRRVKLPYIKTSTSATPAASTSATPIASTSTTPSPSTSKAPLASTSKTPSASTSKTPSASTSKNPSASTSKTPSASTSKTPSASTSKIFSASTSKTSSTSTSKTPSAFTSKTSLAFTSKTPISLHFAPKAPINVPFATKTPINVPFATKTPITLPFATKTPLAFTSKTQLAFASTTPSAFTSKSPSTTTFKTQSASTSKTPSASTSKTPSSASTSKTSVTSTSKTSVTSTSKTSSASTSSGSTSR